MNENRQTVLLEAVAEKLELPDTAYEKAKSRYESLGDWLGRDGSTTAQFDPHIFPQGSFRLGTAIRPLHAREEYDLDLACSLQQGISMTNCSQEQLKALIGKELADYRIAQGIKAPLDEKHRCWRLDYADEMSFHMDIVPCIPGTDEGRTHLTEAMSARGMETELAGDVASLAVKITDDRRGDYRQISSDWLGSNPEGYAKWFESRMIGAEQRSIIEKAQVDNLPLYKRKTTLQRAIQILKRHRDQMFLKNADSKPISIIITTIAGSNYSGNSSIAVTLREIISELNVFVESDANTITNPVNPEENFADRWSMPAHRHLKLKENFHLWVHQLTTDFSYLINQKDPSLLSESLTKRFAINITSETIAATLGIAVSPAVHTKPSRDIESIESKPWYAGK